MDLSTTFDIDTSWLSEGRRTYELTNHLGNVLATISDKRIPVYENDGMTVAYYDVDLLSAVDYYPFGMQMPGRLFNGGGYRYGFNGKENDDEVKGDGNQQDYGLRVYDPRIAKFLSVDPLIKSFPWYTPYQFAGNKPIWAVDLDGAEEKVSTQYTLDYKPVLKAPTVIDGIGNALHNVIALCWNSTGGGFMEAEKSVWNFGVGLFKGEYNHVSGKDLIDNFMVAQEDATRYFTKTPLKQRLSDLGEAATNMSSYEAVVQIWLGTKLVTAPKTAQLSAAVVDVAETRLFNLQSSFEELVNQKLLPKYLKDDPNLKSGYTGSFKTGKVGNPNKASFGQAVDLNKFDIDFWIESDILYEKYGSNLRADPEFRKI
ncbi:hypothetical protein COR50_14170 [Chitinophaga caeni]|uniref:RHS repeat-associated core domain-containing protein n=1 Tax=Chitinophaga caeni TaxID=2029983 RepID=A0A291QWA3_9BACT|nr:RHS repeat-associated core domain-containing protein [Chitinophaga caeni]ATL48217.1 hypothetical protein COR50_14170 [Chitinophaga caeni]